MLLYLDDDSVDNALVRRLADEAHDVLTPRAAGTAGQIDPLHLMFAIRAGRVLFTHDHEDFTVLNDLVLLAGGHHPGILVVRRDNDSNRDMSTGAIVRALRNLIASGIPIPDAVHVLNHWRWVQKLERVENMRRSDSHRMIGSNDVCVPESTFVSRHMPLGLAQ